MRKLVWILTVAFLLCFAHTGKAQSYSDNIRAYIATYKELAMAEAQRTGVPAAITLAQGILETEAGNSRLVRESNNHFGIKCKTEWTGERTYHDDDARGECFRKYTDPALSYRDHSDFLRTRAHYAALFALDPADYEAWAHGLKRAGYATNPKYPALLIKLIRDYDLQQYSLLAINGSPVAADGVATVASTPQIPMSNGEAQPEFAFGQEAVPIPQRGSAPAYPSGKFSHHQTHAIWVEKGSSYFAMAQTYGIPLARLFEFNDMAAKEEAGEGHLVYLQRKRRTGLAAKDTLRSGEGLWQVAQRQGIRLEALLKLNHLSAANEALPGSVLYLQTEGPSRMETAMLQAPLQSAIAAAQSLQESTHTVTAGETLYSIARKYGVEPKALQGANGGAAGLKPGQRLRIPGKEAARSLR